MVHQLETIHDADSTDKPRSIHHTDFGVESYSSTPPTNNNSHFWAPNSKAGSTKLGQSRNNFFIHLGQIIAWPPHCFFQSCPSGSKRARKDRRWAGTRSTCSSHRRQSEDNCLRPTHDDIPRHCSPDVPTRHEKCFEDIGGRTQSRRASSVRMGQVPQP